MLITVSSITTPPVVLSRTNNLALPVSTTNQYQQIPDQLVLIDDVRTDFVRGGLDEVIELCAGGKKYEMNGRQNVGGCARVHLLSRVKDGLVSFDIPAIEPQDPGIVFITEGDVGDVCDRGIVA